MAKNKDRVVKANSLLAYFVEKEADFEGPRTYECPIFEDKFYFLHASMNAEKAANDDKKFKTHEEKITARYWTLCCDENGQRFCHTKDQLQEAVKASMGNRGFARHCVKALVAMNEIDDPDSIDDDDDVIDSEIEGTFDNEKKDSSSTEDAVSQ